MRPRVAGDAMSRVLFVLLLSVYLVKAQTLDSRYAVTQQERTSPRTSLRNRYTPLSPAELLQRVTAARAAVVTSEPRLTAEEEPPITSRTTDIEITTVSSRSYRKQYSGGGNNNRRIPNKQNDASSDVRNLLKQFGPSSLSELLQKKNISLAEFLQNKKLQLALLTEQQQTSEKPKSTEKTTVIVPTTTITYPEKISYTSERFEPTKAYPPEKIRSTSERFQPTKRPTGGAVLSSLYNVDQRSSYLQNKRFQQTPSTTSVYHDTIPHRWSATTTNEDKRVDSREDILELLQPGSPISLAEILSSRNMTLAELMEHRERGSRQRQLSELFSHVTLKNNSITTKNLINLKSNNNNNIRRRVDIVNILTNRVNRGSRDPRLLDMPKQNTYTVEYEAVTEVPTTTTTTTTTMRSLHEIYDYELDVTEEEGQEDGISMAVKSAILASGGLLALTLLLFAAIFLCCKVRQRRRRGSRVPFLRNSRLTRSECSVVIKPAEPPIKNNESIVDF